MGKTSMNRMFGYGLLIVVLAVALFGGTAPAQAQKGGPGPVGPLNPNAPPNYGSATLSVGFTPDPYTIAIGTGGTLSAAEANSSCSGYVTAQPDFNLDWSGGANAFLRIFTDATTIDTTLVVRTPAGQLLCNDDAVNTFQSSVDVFNAVAGRYNIWVGTYSPGATGDATLAITGQDIGPGFLPTPTLRPDQMLDYNLEPNFGTTTLNAGFTPDPFRLDMTSGGTVSVAYLGGGCAGFATSAPDLRLQWGGNSPFLRVRVESSEDTTLVVNAPDGNWYCNDDTFDYNPSVDFQNAAAGQYDIWVGSYNSGTNAAATLFITQVAQNPSATPTASKGGGGLDYNQPPINGVLTINSGFTPDPSTVQVAVGGSVDGSTAGAGCSGTTTAAPTYRVTYTNSTSASLLRFYAQSSDDTTLIVNAPDGNWYCNDDVFGLNPSVDFQNPASGQYDIWVASYGGTQTSATLGVTEQANVPGGALDYNQEPINGSATLNSGFTPDPSTIQITAGGDVYAASVDSTCKGLTTAAPTYRVFYTNQTSATLLRFYAESADDLTLAVNAPDGSWYCSDDTFGSNPGVDFTNPASGQYDVWVGVYNGGTTSATLGVTELVDVPGNTGTSSLDYNLPPVNGSTTLNAGFTPDPMTVSVLAGGPAAASTANASCTGMTTAAPTYRLQYNNAGAGSATFLRFYAESSADTTLAVNAPDGNWYCNDDTFNYNPAVDFQNPVSGQYDIWVGTFGGDSAQATLGVTEQTSVPGTSTTNPPTTGTLDYTLTPNYGSTTLRAGFQPDPFSLSLVSGGAVDVSYLGGGCAGYASAAPDFSLNLDGAAQFLRFYVQSADDTTLVVNTPDGAWQCSDDAFGTNPAVDLNNAAAGRYDIWVGSFGSNTNSNAQLFITGLRTNQPR